MKFGLYDLVDETIINIYVGNINFKVCINDLIELNISVVVY